MIFKDPWIFLLLPFVILLLIWQKRRIKSPALRFPSQELIEGIRPSWKIYFYDAPFYLRLAAVILFAIALAGPRAVLEETVHQSEGIDIVLAIDASGSMAAEDFVIDGKRTNRLAIVKEVVKEFIDGRPNDRMGLVAFGGLAYTVSPLTVDAQWLKRNLERVDLGLIEDGTAVGSAIASALSRLRQSKAKSKIIILLTDGVNNAGKIDPVSAAEAAQALGIKIYTIGAGTKEEAPFPLKDVWGRTMYQMVRIDLDEEMLLKIAEITGGFYFRATDTESLQKIYRQIDLMEKTPIEEIGYKEYRELFPVFLLSGLAVLLWEVILSNTLLLRIP